MDYDIIFVTGEIFFDHPLCGVAILKRLLEKKGYKIGIIEKPQKEEDIRKLGKPKLFFGVTSGAIDSMVRNYTPLKKLRKDDKNLDYNESVPDRAVIVFSNWIKKNFKDSIIALGGTESTLRRFVHYDYWKNSLRKPILMDTRADIMAYGSAEKQIIEIAEKIKSGLPLDGIPGTCRITDKHHDDAIMLPSYEEILESKERFCDMHNLLTNKKKIMQKIDNRYIIQYQSPIYTPKDLDEYYELDYSREVPKKLRGFEFSIITHRGCIGNCNFCSINLSQGDRVISRSERSILQEIKKMTNLTHFKGNIDDLGGPSANMYGMDCNKCDGECINCNDLDKSNRRLIELLQKAREIEGIKNIYIKSGIRFDLASEEYIKEIAGHHIFDTLRIAPEHVNKKVLRLMNKDKGDLKEFIKLFKKTGKKLSYYFIVAHPGSGIKETKELATELKYMKNIEHIQLFTPTPMTMSTCMYYTGMDSKTKKKIHVPYSYSEKKKQKRLILGDPHR